MVYIDTSEAINGLKRLKLDLSGNQKKKAISLAFNDAMRAGRKQLGAEVRKEYTVKISGIGKATHIQRATMRKQFAKLTTKGKPLPLERFATRQIKSGLSVQVLKGKRKIIRSAFMQKVKRKRAFARGNYSGAGFKFRNKRVTKAGNDLPINNLLGPSLPSMIGSKSAEVENKIGLFIRGKAEERLVHFFDNIQHFYNK